MTKHYIRTNENDEIIKIFSTDFEEPEPGDICVKEDAPRHFHLDKPLKDIYGKFNFKYIDKKIVEVPDDERLTSLDREDIEKEALIVEEEKIILRNQAIQNLKDQNKLDADGNLIK